MASFQFHVGLPLARQSVMVCGRRFDFEAGEAVHTEDSHKYTPDSFAELAARAGYTLRTAWRDEKSLFMLAWLESV